MPVHQYQVFMEPPDLEWFRSHLGTERFFAAHLRTEEGSWPVWIGYRGCYSRWFRKPSFDLWFGPERPIGGRIKLHLNAAYRDPSLLRGRLALELFAAIGVPTPSAWHVWLTLNGYDVGLYTAIESFDANWLERHGHPPGSIYYAVGTKSNFSLLDPDTGAPKKFLAAGYERCFPYHDDFSDLESLIYQTAASSDAEFAERVVPLLDVETFLRWLVGVEYLSHTDGVIQNYALFRPGDGLWEISPWDCDGTMGRIPDGRTYAADRLEAGTGIDNGLMSRLLKVPHVRERYCRLWEELLEGELAPEQVARRLERLVAEIRPAVLKDSNKRESNRTFSREPERIRRYVRERIRYIRREMLEARR